MFCVTFTGCPFTYPEIGFVEYIIAAFDAITSTPYITDSVKHCLSTGTVLTFNSCDNVYHVRTQTIWKLHMYANKQVTFFLVNCHLLIGKLDELFLSVCVWYFRRNRKQKKKNAWLVSTICIIIFGTLIIVTRRVYKPRISSEYEKVHTILLILSARFIYSYKSRLYLLICYIIFLLRALRIFFLWLKRRRYLFRILRL